MSLLEIIQDEKCKMNCSDKRLCVCYDQANKIYEEAMKRANINCSFMNSRSIKNCIHTEPYCECRDDARKELGI